MDWSNCFVELATFGEFVPSGGLKLCPALGSCGATVGNGLKLVGGGAIHRSRLFDLNTIYGILGDPATPCVPDSDLVLELGDDGAEIVTAELSALNAEVWSMEARLSITDPAIPLEVCLLKSLHHDAGGVSVEFDCRHGWFPLFDSLNIHDFGARGGSGGHFSYCPMGW